jgi:putative addiction module killer protein
MLPSQTVEVHEYLDFAGRSPFGDWFDSLNAQAAAKVAIAVTKLKQGNFSNVRSMGSDFGPGYRIYFGRDGDRLVILVGGGTKKRQQNDIYVAVGRWEDYKRRKE